MHKEQGLLSLLKMPVAANDHGFVLVMALVMLVILSIMSAAAMTVRNTEQQVIVNLEVMQNNFYAVEAVTLEGTMALENLADATLLNLDATTLSWLKPNDPKDVTPDINLTLSSAWDQGSASIKPVDTVLDSGTTKITPQGYNDTNTSTGDRIWYAALQGNLATQEDYYDLCPDEAVSDEDKVVKCYSVYGMYDVKSGAGKSYHGRRMLMVGYKKTIYKE